MGSSQYCELVTATDQAGYNTLIALEMGSWESHISGLATAQSLDLALSQQVLSNLLQ